MSHPPSTALSLDHVQVDDFVWVSVTPGSMNYENRSLATRYFVGDMFRTSEEAITHRRYIAACGKLGREFGFPYKAAVCAHRVVSRGPSPLLSAGDSAGCAPMWETLIEFEL